jgi:Ca2+-transporting ATPase
MKEILWHCLEIEKVSQILKTDFQKGLAQKEAERRQKIFGKNKLPEEKPFIFLKILISQFKSPLIYILAIAGFIALFLEEWTDASVIFGAVILNTFIGFFQEYKAAKTLNELKKAVEYQAKVIRQGEKHLINFEELVPGDIILLNSGDKVPADCRLIEVDNLKTDDSVLTGEWLPQKKTIKKLPERTPLGDRENMVYMGTIVEEGRGKAVVVAIGKNTEIGKIATQVKEIEEGKTPLQFKISKLSRSIGIILAFLIFFIFIEGIVTGNKPDEMFIVAVALAVAAIPEGLPISLTVTMAIGMRRILKQKGLVRKMIAAETLGSTNIICTDKTGTITYGKMEVVEVYLPEAKKEKEELLFKALTFCNNAFIEKDIKTGKKKFVGNMTEKALLKAVLKAGFDREELLKEEQQIKFSPFNPKKKYALSIHQKGKDNYIVYLLGAPEILLGRSRNKLAEKEKILKKLKELTQKRYRVIGAAYKNLSSLQELKEDILTDISFLGLIALRDPIREDVKEAIRITREAGIRPIIVTGDHKITAQAIAQEIGIKAKKENILEGEELSQLTEKDFQKRLDKITIYARVAPEHKTRIIEAWQRKGKVVAMTGDGINDAPALKKADIGIALGSGTDVAKETADLILLNNSFSIIVAAIEEGRGIITNIRKVITYILTDTFSEIILVGTSILLGLPLPILPAQILWINLVEDSFPAFALALEPKEKDLMKRKPEPKEKPLLTKEMKFIIFGIGIIRDFILLGLFLWFYFHHLPLSYIRTMIFAALGVDSLMYIYACRNLSKNIWQFSIFSNKHLILSSFLRLIAIFCAIYLPLFQKFLRTVPLLFFDWLIVFSIGLLILVIVESAKYFYIKEEKLC